MKIPGKIIHIAAAEQYQDMPPGIYALTSEGKVYVAYDDVPPEEWNWTEVSLKLEDA